MLGLLCGGQGSLSPRTFDLVADEPAAAPVFALASRYLGHDPRDLIRSPDADELSVNRTSQILTITAILALHACIVAALPQRFAVTGYSVGEMAAWHIAGVWSAEETLRLTDARARAMDAAAGNAGGRLGYVRGLGRKALEALAERHGCAIAIINPCDLFVVGGTEPAVAALCRDARAATPPARADLLAVKTPSHTPRLSSARPPLLQALGASNYAAIPHGITLLAGTDGRRVYSPAEAFAELAAQVARTVDWAATLQAVVETGADRVLDLGPGHALADMMRDAAPAMPCHAAEDFRTLEGLRRWITAT